MNQSSTKPATPVPPQRLTRSEGLGLRIANSSQLIEQVERGFSYKSLHTLKARSGLPIAEIAKFAGIPERTLARRKAKGKFTPEESERLLRLSTLLELAVELFEGDHAAALRWLSAPRKALAGNTPLAYARTEVGAREVENLIGRMEAGVFA